jgi:ferredoxin-thioredoxin reductase catalytic subunit
MKSTEITEKEVEDKYLRLKEEADAAGYQLHPDSEFAEELVKGIIVNEKRYGYGACPCRLAAGTEKDDLDIQCPCDYRDKDLNEFGQCYCGLYVSEDLSKDPKRIGSIPERRGKKVIPDSHKETLRGISDHLSVPVWRCTVCGYLCAREEPPLLCPICKAKKERFERFL